MLNKTVKSLVLASTMLLSTAAIAHAAGIDRDAVLDQNKNTVIDSRGNCVRTTWHSSGDECAGPKDTTVIRQEKQVVVPSPARQLTKEQKVVYFEFDKAGLDAEAKANLDNLANVLKGSADVKNASIVGYADIIGTDSYNQKLSEQRAANVKSYLAEKGYFNTSIAQVRALGKTDQFASCDNMKRPEKIKCLRPNRRVELEIQFVD